MRRSQPLLGTFVTISAYGDDPDSVHAAINAAFEEIRRVDLLLSIHKPESETARLNARAAQNPVSVSPELRAFIAEALRIARMTEGAFDPTIGPLAQLWGFIWKEYRLPTSAELARTLPLVNYKEVLIGTNNMISFGRPEMFFDFGGIGKGYAVDRAILILQQHKIAAAMVKAGGDLRVIGTPPGERAWVVQIEDPEKEGQRAVMHLRDQAMSTSGNYENFFEIDGRRYSHIIDPRTGIPIEGIASCTVVAPTCTQSDALATGFFVLGIEVSLRKFGDDFGIRFVDTNLKTYQSPSFPTAVAILHPSER